jgi:hypothetical protein
LRRKDHQVAQNFFETRAKLAVQGVAPELDTCMKKFTAVRRCTHSTLARANIGTLNAIDLALLEFSARDGKYALYLN